MVICSRWSCNNTRWLPANLAPFSPHAHALPEREMEDLLDTHSSLCRAFDILCPNLPRHLGSLFGRDWGLTLGPKHPSRLLVAP